MTNENLSDAQFGENPLHRRWAPREVQNVPIAELDYAHSMEYDVPGRDLEKGYADRLNDHPDEKDLNIDALTEDVRQNGIHRPISMASNPRTDEYGHPMEQEHTIQDGTHRLLAAQRAGLSHVPIQYKRL